MSTISEIYLNGNSYDEMWLNNELIWQKSGYLPLQYNWGYDTYEDYVNQTNLKGYENNTYIHIVVPNTLGSYRGLEIAPLDNNLKLSNYYLVRGEIYQKSGDDSYLAFHEGVSMESPSLLGMGEWHSFNACIQVVGTNSALSGGFIEMTLPIYSELPSEQNEYYLRLKTIEETDMTTEYFVYGDEIPEIEDTTTNVIDFTQSSAPTLPSYLTVDYNGTYSFSHGLYTTDVYGLIPSNKGVNSSTAYTRYKYVAPASGDLTFTYRCYAETNYDYLTVHVTTTTSQPSYSSSTNQVFTTKGVSSYQNTDGTASVSVVEGTTYYIHIQYRKDGSSSSGYDMGCIRSIEFPISGTSGGDTSVVYGDIVLSTSDLYVTEGTTSSSLGVKLSQSPTNAQTVTYTYTSDRVATWSNTFTFDSTNWATYQYVAFTPALDGLYTDRTDTITFTSDGVENVSVSVFVTNTEQENTGGGDTGSLARESLSTWSSDLQYYDIYTPISTKNIDNMTLTTDSANRSFKMYCNTDYNKYGGAITTLSLPFQTGKFYKVSLKLRGKFGGTYSRNKTGVVKFGTYPYVSIGIDADNLSETSYSQYDFVIAVNDYLSMELDLKLYNGVSTTGTSYGNYTLAGDWIEIKDFMFKEYDALPSIPKNTIYNGFTYETLTNISIGNYTSSSYASYSTDTTNNTIKYYCSTALSYGSTKTIVELEPCQKYEITGLARGTNGVGDIVTTSLLGDEVYLLYDNGITINETTYTEFTVYVDVDYTSYYTQHRFNN